MLFRYGETLATRLPDDFRAYGGLLTGAVPAVVLGVLTFGYGVDTTGMAGLAALFIGIVLIVLGLGITTRSAEQAEV